MRKTKKAGDTFTSSVSYECFVWFSMETNKTVSFCATKPKRASTGSSLFHILHIEIDYRERARKRWRVLSTGR